MFFNIGIDQEAVRAERSGNIGPQEKNNSDNLRILVEYVRKFKQKNYFNHISEFYTNIEVLEIFDNLGKINNNDEALIDDLMMVLKKEIAGRKSRNVDILNLASTICYKLCGEFQES